MTVSEEGPSHLTDDGWAETQKQIVEILDFITNLQSCDRQVEDLQSVGGRNWQVEELQNFGGQGFHKHDLMQFTEQHVGGTADDMEIVVPADGMQHDLDNILCDHDQQMQLQQQQPLASTATARAIDMQQISVGGDMLHIL